MEASIVVIFLAALFLLVLAVIVLALLQYRRASDDRQLLIAILDSHALEREQLQRYAFADDAREVVQLERSAQESSRLLDLIAARDDGDDGFPVDPHTREQQVPVGM